MDKGWFSINREMFNHWIWQDKPFNKGCAWVDLIGLANHADAEDVVRDKVIKLKRGNVNRSFRYLANRWGWSVGKVQRFISALEKEKMVTQKENQGETIISINNYEKYQKNGTEKGQKTEQETEQETEHKTEQETEQDYHIELPKNSPLYKYYENKINEEWNTK